MNQKFDYYVNSIKAATHMKGITSIFLILWTTISIAQESESIAENDSLSINQESDTVEVSVNNEVRQCDQPRNKHTEREIQTLSGSLNHSGGYGALIFKGSELLGETIIMTGFRGAWVLNRSFGIGFEANGVIPVAKFDGIDPEGERKAILLGGYGGLFIEPIFWSNRAIHIAFPISAGTGWLGYIEDWDDNDNTYNYEDNLYDDDVFWYIEPGAVIEFNVSRSFRLDFGITKRFTEDLVLVGTDASEFENFNYSFAMKFGGF